MNTIEAMQNACDKAAQALSAASHAHIVAEESQTAFNRNETTAQLNAHNGLCLARMTNAARDAFRAAYECNERTAHALAAAHQAQAYQKKTDLSNL